MINKKTITRTQMLIRSFYETRELFSLEEPAYEVTNERTIIIKGWYVSRFRPRRLRLVTPSGDVYALSLNVPRQDVVNHFAGHGRSVSLRSGFSRVVSDFEEGTYTVEGWSPTAGWYTLQHFLIEYDPHYLPPSYYRSLNNNYFEHTERLDLKRQYFYESAATRKYVRKASDQRVVAFYLPQYHAFEENDKWWGKGFTEWRNVGAARPRFVGHEQPRVPADLGYYNLLRPEVHREQMDLAQGSGVYGFCYYYYWFSGKRLLDKPLDIVLRDKSLSMPFMICWANENWTRRWDGLNHDVLIKQEHKPGDPEQFIRDVEDILLDERYITIDGKPVLMVYRAEDLKDPREYTRIWREYFRKTHDKELHLVAVRSFDFGDPESLGFDKGLDFAPLSLRQMLAPRGDSGPLDNFFTGAVFDYRKTIQNVIASKQVTKDYQTVFPSWDNDARRKGQGSSIFYGANPLTYGLWLKDAIERSQQAGLDFTFINAWNEWAEGAYLEPDTTYGHAYLNRTAEVIRTSGRKKPEGERKSKNKVAVVLHLYYADLWPLFAKYLKRLGDEGFDLHISLSNQASKIKAEVRQTCSNVYFYELPNVGRDVLPFIHICTKIDGWGYESILKLHSKKSLHRDDGSEWLEDMLMKLVPSQARNRHSLMKTLADESTAIIGPDQHFISLRNYLGSNKVQLEDILDDLGLDTTCVDQPKKYGFFAGTMFWARYDAIRPLIQQYYHLEKFDVEAGQLDGTFAHAFERALALVPQLTGRNTYTISNNKSPAVFKVDTTKASAKYEYVEKKKIRKTYNKRKGTHDKASH